MKNRFGFTVVELIITMAIVAILLTLGVANLRSTEVTGRDEKRKTDVNNIALFLESIYSDGIESIPGQKGSYPPVQAASSIANIESWFKGYDLKSLRAPGVSSPNYSLTSAANNTQTIAGVSPQPTITTYIYQPIDGSGALCSTQGECRKFNLYYLPEAKSSQVVQVVSRNQ